MTYAIDDVVNYLIGIAILTACHDNSFIAIAILIHELAKARNIRGQGWDAQRDTLQRRVAPRLIIRWEYGEVKSGKEF